MGISRSWEKATILLLMSIELGVFSGSFPKFFNQDSIFYQIYAPRSWQQFERLLLAPDSGGQYRPLTLIVMGPLVQLLGMNPHPYHWIPLVFHLINTLLFYCLARRVLDGSLGPLFATAIWGLHSVVGWITYDVTCISDFLLAFLLLCCLILAVEGRAKRSSLLLSCSTVLFLFALLTKESALMIPLALFLVLGLTDLRFTGDAPTIGAISRSFRKAVPLTCLFLGISAAYASLLFHWLKNGLIYSQRAGSAYHIDPWANALGKTRYVFWALNLPDNLAIRHGQAIRVMAFALMIVLLVVLLVELLRMFQHRAIPPVLYAGLVWFAGMNLPALLLSHRLAKWYLYVPLMGLALALGALATNLFDWVPKWREPFAVPLILGVTVFPILFSSYFQQRSYLAASDAVFQSDLLRACIEDFRDAHPVLPERLTLYLLPSLDVNASAVLSSHPINRGELYKLFYPRTEFETLFAYRGDRLPADYASRPDVRIIQYLNGHFHDETDYYKGRRGFPGRHIIPDLDTIRVHVSRNEFYPDYDHFDTLSGKAVFFPTPEKEILTQIGGSTATLSLGVIPAGASMSFDVSWMSDMGDGGWAELGVRAEEMESVLFHEYMLPNPKGKGLRWQSVRVDLSPFEGRQAELILKCYNEPGKNTVADWLNWRDLLIEWGQATQLGTRSNRPEFPSIDRRTD